MIRRLPSIAVLTEGTSPNSFLLTLKENFHGHTLREIRARELSDRAFLRQTDLLVLPGIANESSPYPEFMKAAAGPIMDAMRDDGLCVWSSCAPVYHLSREKTYISDRLNVTARPGIGFLEGTTWGPVDGPHGPAPTGRLDPKYRFSDVRLMRVLFNDLAGHEITAHIPYSNGPAYDPAPGEAIDVIARYADLPGVAIGGKAFGKGYLLFEGVLPEMKLSHMPSREEIKSCDARTQRLYENLIPHDAGREVLMQKVAHTLERRMKTAAPMIRIA